MEFRIRMAMRARTAFVLFLASIVAGGVAVFAAAFVSDPSLAAVRHATKASSAKSSAAKSAADSVVQWRDLGAALDEAKASNKIIVADVYTDWCGWCRRMDADTYAKGNVQEYLNRSFVPVRLNAEANTRVHYAGGDYSYAQVALGFGITSYPTTLFLAPDGKHLANAPGYLKAEDFLTILRYFGDGHYKSQTFQQYEDALEAAATPTPPPASTRPTDH
jgi:thioredoxin-related protein